MQIDDLLEPSKTFKNLVKPTHKQNVEDFYDNLVKESKLDVELNRDTVKKIKAKEKKIADTQKMLGKKKALKGFMIFLSVAAFVASVIFGFLAFTDNDNNLVLKIVIAAACLILGLVLLIFVVRKISASIKNISKTIEDLINEKNKLVAEAWSQMAALNSLFDWNIASDLFTKTIPLIKLDRQFDEEKYQMLHEKYGFEGNPEKNISSVFVQSGSILGNAFLIEKNYVQEMHDVPYSGSIVITWVTTYTDSEGHRRTQTHTQTLTATIYKPAPYYYYDTWLVYGNDAAGNLSFTRCPSKANEMNEKQLQKFIDGYDKKLDKLTQESISKGTNFQRLGNNEFEALFNALDRDNNIEFRLLFTPLAQKNMVNLITEKEPYGDDFYFVKKKNLNYIKSLHSQDTNFDDDPEIFSSFYDYDLSRDFFIRYNENYMQSLYYDLAPLMSIPLYQQHAAQEYIYQGTICRNVTEIETEVLANSFNSSDFKPDDCETDVILKTGLLSKNGTADFDSVVAYGFRTVSHTDYISKLGGDGSMHDIPVTWLEYIPVQKESKIVVQKLDMSKKDYDDNYRNGKINEFLSKFSTNNDMIFKKGFISFQGDDSSSSYQGNELDKYFRKGE